MPAEATAPSPSLTTNEFVDILRQRKLQMEERLHQQVNMSRLATFLMARADDDDDDGIKKVVEAGNNVKALETHKVQLVSVVSDISCSCSEWEHEHDADDADDEAESRRSEGNTSSDMSNLQPVVVVAAAAAAAPQKDAIQYKKTLARRQSTPNTNVTTTSSSSSQSNSDIECAIPEFSSTKWEGLVTGALAGGKGARHASGAASAFRESVDHCEILNKQFADNDCTTLTADPESRVVYRMKGPLLAVVGCLGLVIVMLVVAVLVMTILTLCRHHPNHPLATSAASAAHSLAPQLAPSPMIMSPSQTPVLRPTTQ